MKTISISEDRPTTYVEKVCATSQCIWCKVKFDDYAIRCRVCGNCQYCGRFCVNADHCMLCGNNLPEDIQNSQVKRVVRFE